MATTADLEKRINKNSACIETLENKISNGDVVPSSTSLGKAITDSIIKTTPVDTDYFALTDSAASNIAKKTSWLNIKTTLKTYFDTVATTLTNKTLTSPAITGNISLPNSSVIDNTGWLDPTASTQKAPLVGGRLDVKFQKAVGVRALGYFATKANINSAAATLTDVTTVDALYGTTALQATIGGNVELIVAPTAVLTVPVNITDGIIRLMLKPIANLKGNLNKFEIQLHSALTPATAGANYHSINAFAAPADLHARLTASAGTGRWQGYSIAVNQFTATGTGADLTQITFARLVLRSASTNVTVQLGNIDFVPNKLTKAKCILSFDDAYLSHLTYAAAQMSKYGFRGVLFPSPITTFIGSDATRLTAQQIKNMHDNLGWQIGSQSWSTEDSTLIDAMTETEFTTELSKLRTWQNTLGLTGGEHGSYFSNVGIEDLIAYPTFRKHYRSMRTYFVGQASVVPLQFGETFPFGDPMAVRAVNGATSSWAATTGAMLQAHIDQAITNKGVAYLAWHNDLASAGNARTGFDTLLAYLDSHRSTIDVVTEEELYI